MGLDPKFVNLEELFQGRLFKIPEYQRSYSWEKKHRTDLLDDIKASFDNNKPHFMATVVGLKHEESETIAAKKYQYVDIVDGQQRITTLIILYKAICEELGETGEEKQVKQDLTATLVKRGGEVLLLQTNHDTSYHFLNYIRNGSHVPPDQAKTSADRNLLEAIDDCKKFVKKWKDDKDTLMGLVVHINNNMNLVYHQLDSESLVYSVFEVLNRRGLEISWFDQLKSMLMSMVFDKECDTTILHEIHVRWSKIFSDIGTLPVSKEVLRFAATLDERDNRIFSEEKSADHLVDRAKGECTKIIETVGWIKEVAQSVVKVHKDKHEVSISKIMHARLVAVAIDLRVDLTNNEKIELRKYLAKITFYIYGICQKDARTAVGEYVRLAYDINKNKIDPKLIKDKLDCIVGKHLESGSIESLVRGDCYNGWQDELRYLLYKYEQHLLVESGQVIPSNEQWTHILNSSASKTIEHILPQSNHGKHVHWLGNLFLLPPGINAKLGNVQPRHKKDEYNKTGFLMVQDIIGSLPGWNKTKIIKRGKKIVQWAKEEWKFIESSSSN